MNAILTNSHLDIRIEWCVQINEIVPKLAYTWYMQEKYGKETRDSQKKNGKGTTDDSIENNARILKHDE